MSILMLVGLLCAAANAECGIWNGAVPQRSIITEDSIAHRRFHPAPFRIPHSTFTSAPTAITIATSRGAVQVAVRTERGHPALAAIQLERLLPVTKTVQGGWAEVRFADQPFRFLLDAPVVLAGGRLLPLLGGAYVSRDTLFVPLQWLTDHVPRMFREGYRYDPLAARFEEVRPQPVVASSAPVAIPANGPRVRAPSDLARRNGFRMQHKVVIDPGHGGNDPGTPGHYLPRGVDEKHIVLAIGLKVQEELERRGVEVVMTRTRDVLVPWESRAPSCRDDCTLFASIHVNSLPRPSNSVSGFETYFLGDQVTADAARVARMENEALGYEVTGDDGALAFILKDLHTNEYLRQSAALAQAIQRHASRTHPGGSRGVHQARLIVLGTAVRPAVLIETGYATNRRDAQYIVSPAGQAELAKGIADGIAAYLQQYENQVLGGRAKQ
jgi:N-acetylmuramoyl-L-alanine amidase